MDLICFFLSFADINQLLEVMRERKLARTKVSEGVLPQYGEMGTALKNVSNFFFYFLQSTLKYAFTLFTQKKNATHSYLQWVFF
jgi:hypothetical protein